MTVVTKFPTNNAPVLNDGWDNPTYAYADDTNYATKTSSSSTRSSFYDWGFEIPESALIHEVVIEFKGKASFKSAFNMWNIKALIGGINCLDTVYEESTSDTVIFRSITSNCTPSELNTTGTDGLVVQIGADIGSGTPTYSLQYVKVIVLYSVPVGTFQLKYPTTLGGTLWMNSDNVKAKFGGSATANNTTGEMIGSDFGFEIPSGATINSVIILARCTRVSTGNQVGFQIAYDGTKRGTRSDQITQNYDYTYINTDTGEWTIDELNNALLQLYIKAVNSYLYCDCISVLVDYTESASESYDAEVSISQAYAMEASGIKFGNAAATIGQLSEVDTDGVKVGMGEASESLEAALSCHGAKTGVLGDVMITQPAGISASGTKVTACMAELSHQAILSAEGMKSSMAAVVVTQGHAIKVMLVKCGLAAAVISAYVEMAAQGIQRIFTPARFVKPHKITATWARPGSSSGWPIINWKGRSKWNGLNKE